MLLVHLATRIPVRERLWLRTATRIGIGTIDRHGAAIVSVPSPWSRDAGRTTGRARWRLDSYGGEHAATRLLRHLDEWRSVRAAGRTRLTITAASTTDPLPLRFGWTRP